MTERIFTGATVVIAICMVCLVHDADRIVDRLDAPPAAVALSVVIPQPLHMMLDDATTSVLKHASEPPPLPR